MPDASSPLRGRGGDHALPSRNIMYLVFCGRIVSRQVVVCIISKLRGREQSKEGGGAREKWKGKCQREQERRAVCK